MTRPSQPNNLTDRDLEVFARFGIDGHLLDEGGIRRVSDRQAREQLNSSHRGDLSGVLFPYIDPQAGHPVTLRVRRDHPELDAAGKPQAKYIAAYGDSPHVYFVPGAGPLLDDVAVPVVIVEAEKSALAFTAAGRRQNRRLLSIALGGCWGWRTQRAGKAPDATGARVNTPGPQPDLGRIAWTGRDVVIVFDCNAATNPKVRQARRQLADHLVSCGAHVRIGAVPVEPGVNGPDDYRAAHDDAVLLMLLDDAVPVQKGTVDELLDDCGAMALATHVDASQAESVIRAARDALRGADALRVSAVRSRLVSLLRDKGIGDAGRLVDAAIGRDAAGSDASKPPARIVEDTEPWPESVDGVAVLDAVRVLIIKYVVLTNHQATACALWLAHAFTLDAFDHSPILAVLSPVKRCGKSTLLSVLAALADRALHAANASTAVLFRLIESRKPTLLLDEADTWLHDDKAELRGVVNSGWSRRGAVALRCEGDDAEPRTFSTWAPKVLAAIGKLPDTIGDRSIPVLLRRKTRDEGAVPLRSRTLEHEAGDLRRQLRRWADDHVQQLALVDPSIPDALNDRAADSWRPLLAIADTLGGDWPTQARAASLTLSGQSDDDAADGSLPSQLLADLGPLVADHDGDVLETAVLLKALHELPDRPWSDFRHGKPVNGHQLARLLTPFGCVPSKVRIGARTTRGYGVDRLRDALARYTPVPGASKVEQGNRPSESGPESLFSERNTEPVCSTSQSGTNPMNTGSVPVFHSEASEKPPSGAYEVI